MKLPFTTEEFLNLFREYNSAVWPMQVLFYTLSLFSIFIIIKKRGWAGKFVWSVLSFFWLWMGLVYHLLFFSAINKAAYFFGTAFIIQGLLFLYQGLHHTTVSFHFNRNVYGITGLLLVVCSLVAYPLIGYAIGHQYPYSPTFGVPCPTSIFTFGVLLWTNEKVDIRLLIIPFLWSLVGFSAALSLGIYEDSLLLISSVTALLLLWIKNRKHAIAV